MLARFSMSIHHSWRVYTSEFNAMEEFKRVFSYFQLRHTIQFFQNKLCVLQELLFASERILSDVDCFQCLYSEKIELKNMCTTIVTYAYAD